MNEENKNLEETKIAQEAQAKSEAPAESAEQQAPAAEAQEVAEVKTDAPAQTESKVEVQSPRAPSAESKAANAKQAEQRAKRGPGAKDKKGSKRRSRADQEQQQSEYIEKVVQVRRVTKVCKGGKKLSFRTTVIIGNEKGKVGVGVGKAAEVLVAIKKAIADARKKVVDISTVPNTNTISHTVQGISGGSKVMLKPAADGTGIIAGGTARIVLELAGVGDILSKSQGSKSPLNVARATVNALGQLRSFQEVAQLRGISVKKMLFAS